MRGCEGDVDEGVRCRLSLAGMSTSKATAKKSRTASKSSASTRASAKRFASTFYRKHGAVMSKLSRA